MGQFLGRQARAARSQTIGEMNIVWSPEAIEDLASLRAYIAEDNPAAARRTVRHIIESIEQLIPDNPRIGRAGRLGIACILAFYAEHVLDGLITLGTLAAVLSSP
jgi:ParE toxin of type II toxin-antitoxin system, parDE